MIKVGIIGATGYVGVELLRLLFNHNDVSTIAISSKTFKDKRISEIYENFSGIIDFVCEDEDMVIEKSDIIFGALPHGLSEGLAFKILKKEKKFIDIGADFRLKNEEDYEKWYKNKFNYKPLHEKSVYSIPEFHRNKVIEGNYSIISNPGCYPTSIALGIVPAIINNLVKENTLIIDSKSGVTGSGRGLSLSSHFVECNESMNAYAVGGVHRHTPEIEQIINEFSNNLVKITFTPHLIPINRGILSTIYFDLNKNTSIEDIHKLYINYYKDEFFIKILPLGSNAKIKNVTNSNYCNISIHKDERCNRVIICSVIDNMVKGAAGQAIQNMNLLLGIEENTGLKVLATAF